MDGLICEFDNFEQYVRWRMRQKSNADALDPLQVSVRLGVTPEAVYAAITRGLLRFVRIKGGYKQTRIYIPVWSIEAYELRGRVAARMKKAHD